VGSIIDTGTDELRDGGARRCSRVLQWVSLGPITEMGSPALSMIEHRRDVLHKR
jgi:hypothetical protein